MNEQISPSECVDMYADETNLDYVTGYYDYFECEELMERWRTVSCPFCQHLGRLEQCPYQKLRYNDHGFLLPYCNHGEVYGSVGMSELSTLSG